jgi:hypothetical protein
MAIWIRNREEQNTMQCNCVSASANMLRSGVLAIAYSLLLSHHRPLLRKAACALPQLDYIPKRFAAFAERISANWLSPTRSQPFSHTFQEGESRALEPLLSLADEASPTSTTRNPSLTRMNSGRMHEAVGRLQHHLRPCHTILRCAGAICEST